MHLKVQGFSPQRTLKPGGSAYCGGDVLQAEVLVKAQQEAGEVMGELGLAFIKIAKFETEEAFTGAQRVHSNDAKRIGTAAVKGSRCYREANAQSMKHLVRGYGPDILQNERFLVLYRSPVISPLISSHLLHMSKCD